MIYKIKLQELKQKYFNQFRNNTIYYAKKLDKLVSLAKILYTHNDKLIKHSLNTLKDSFNTFKLQGIKHQNQKVAL